MKKYLTLILVGSSLVGCSDTTRTIIVSEERAPLAIPADYRNPTLPMPKEDSVLKEYQKNNFLGTSKSTPLPLRRPY